jgi:hypothetical protein
VPFSTIAEGISSSGGETMAFVVEGLRVDLRRALRAKGRVCSSAGTN